MKLLKILFGGRHEERSAPSDLFDVHHAKTLQAVGFPLKAPADAAELGAPVREFYLHNPDAQGRYPLALLPMGQKRWVKWLVRNRGKHHDFSDAQILAFLHATAADLPAHVALTYRIHPGWQQQFPALDDGGRNLIAWLRSQFPKYKRLRAVRSIPLQLRPAKNALEGVNLLSHFCYPSGLQQAALGYKADLEAAGFLVSCRDVPTGVRTELAPREEWLGFEEYPVTITNVAPAPHFANRYGRAGLARRTGVLQIAYWAWELETIPDEWTQLADGVDEIWTLTPFVAAAMQAKMPVPVYSMLLGVSIGEVESVPRARLGIAEDEFVFLFMFDMRSDFERKNPLAIVRAFRAAFRGDDRAKLVIKLSRGSSDPANLERLRAATEGANVRLIDEVVPRARAYGYIAMADCIVSLHRSEGFGLLMAEAMLLGKPVIATNYSGNTAFMEAENSVLISYAMVEIAEDGSIYKQGNRWADPSVEEAAAAMRRLFDHREEAALLGERARTAAAERLSPAAASARMKARLEQLWRERGPSGS